MSAKRWNVLIADDEPKVCELIEYLIPWDELGLSLKAVVHNGLEAMEVLAKEPVDIVITDARMPECDGIELLKWCHQKQLRMKYIVISGYRHFEYAHGALQYGVDAYLLKPINQKQLIEELKIIVEKLASEHHVHQTEAELKEQMSRDRDKMRRHFINSYIFDGRHFCEREIDSMEEINEEYQMKFSEGVFQAFFIKVDNVENAGYKMDKLLIKIRELAEEQMRGVGNELIGTMLHSGVVFCINYPIDKEDVFEQKIEVLYKEIENLLDIFEGLQMTIGIGSKEVSISSMRRSIASAGDAVKYRIVVKKGIIRFSQYNFSMPVIEQIWTTERSSLLESCIRNGNQEGIQRMLFDIRGEFRKDKNISPVALFELIQEISSSAAKILHRELTEDIWSARFHEFDEIVDRAVSEDYLWIQLESLLVSCIELRGNQLQMQNTKPIRLMKAYIDDHFMEQISLEIVAENIGLSASYASTIFKKEAGVSFMDYLISKRMDAATELLRKTDLNIGEIGMRVGYPDEKYFSKLCKKTLGMKPSVYRKLYS